MADIPEALTFAGRVALDKAKWLGGKVAGAYRKVDPDVPRHLLHLPLLSYSLLVKRDAPIEAVEPDGHLPLVLVHGLGANRGTFLPLAAYLWMHGRRRTYRVDFGSHDSVDAMAVALADFVNEVIAVTGEEEVEIVAHSLGGIVTRLAMIDYGIDDSVRTLITLGTPHHGTHAARFANTRFTRDLRPDSELITRLTTEPLPEHVHAFTCWSANDLFVLPSDSAALAETEQIDLTPATHYSYLFQPSVLDSVRRSLETAEAASRPPARSR